MKGVIVVNGYYVNESYTHQVGRLKDEFAQKGVFVDIYVNNKPTIIGTHYNFEFAVFLDKDFILAALMEKQGVKVFNCAKAIENTDSKIKTAILLQDYDIKMPLTIPAPVQYKYTFDIDYLRQVGKKLSYPVVIKTAQGSLGTGVYLASNIEELCIIDKKLQNCDKLYQQYIAESRGESYRVIVIGGKVITAMHLHNDKDFRSNVNLGGTASVAILNERYTVLAENIARYCQLDYCGIDFFVGSEMLLEVNSNAFYKKAEEITNVNIAKVYTDYILDMMGEKL